VTSASNEDDVEWVDPCPEGIGRPPPGLRGLKGVVILESRLLGKSFYMLEAG
jgi:hypothetical protein